MKSEGGSSVVVGAEYAFEERVEMSFVRKGLSECMSCMGVDGRRERRVEWRLSLCNDCGCVSRV